METLKTDTFDKWLKKLGDKKAKAVIQVGINRLIIGNFGKVKSLGGGVHEKKINYGPGYRIYFYNYNQKLIILLCGGDKSSQQNDIARAIILSKAVKIELKGKR